MNKDLQGREFELPQEIIRQLNNTITLGDGDNSGIKRAKKLVNDGKVNYGQLKRILHDLEKNREDIKKYNLYGGKAMEDWGWKMLGDDRNLIQTRKESKERSRNITGMGENAHNKKHTKKPSFLPPTNVLKSNSDTTSFSSILPSMKLFEQEIKRIKSLMN